jgi:predicted MFS family arabinose efflux permease
MIGLGIGVLLAQRTGGFIVFRSLVIIQMISLGFILLGIFSIFIFKNYQIPSILIYLVFSLLILGMAAITGVQFHIASGLKPGEIQQIAATVYSADLLGSASGALLVNAFIVPMLGLVNALLVVAGVILVVILLMLVKKKL